MAVGSVILSRSGHAAWDDLATWWLSRYKVSTQQTYATYLPRWTAWCAGRGLDPLQAGRADVELWLRAVVDSGLSRASVAGHYDALASIYRLAREENLVAVDPCARIGKGDKPARVPVPLPALPAVQATIDNRTSGPLLRTRSGAGMDRRSVHRYVARTAQAAGIARPIGPHALRRTVGTVGLNQGIPLRDIQRLLRHARPETTLASYDVSGDALERHASHQVACFLAGWAS